MNINFWGQLDSCRIEPVLKCFVCLYFSLFIGSVPLHGISPQTRRAYVELLLKSPQSIVCWRIFHSNKFITSWNIKTYTCLILSVENSFRIGWEVSCLVCVGTIEHFLCYTCMTQSIHKNAGSAFHSFSCITWHTWFSFYNISNYVYCYYGSWYKLFVLKKKLQEIL